jgi:ubiquinone/menaquinone biosynthesis C-methylase UbiE
MALKELTIINKYLGGISTTKSALKYFISNELNELRIIDIGSGSSDNLIAAKYTFPNLKIISIDKNLSVLNYSNNNTTKINADAFKLSIKNNSCDIVHVALFLHHFDEEQLKALLNEFLRISKKGIIINDLQRSYFAFLGIKLLTILFSKSTLVKNDAPISVKKSFIKSDLLNFILSAGVTKYIIKRKWAFRWMVLIKK